MSTDTRQTISDALADFDSETLPEAARHFLGVLGYASDRTIPVSSPADFCAQFDPEGRLNHPAALKQDWKSIHLLFQLTDDELARESMLFTDSSVNTGLLRSYLFFAVELTGDHYARTKLTGLARQINRLFPMPVMVLIRHRADGNPVLSIAVINRRPSKRDAAKDVLGKVTIIRDISVVTPHLGHLDILASFALPNLVHPQRIPINNFDALHSAWEEIFNVELLNKRFYEDLARWYFWALPQVQFPSDLEPDEEKRNATSLIRLLTRLIFCWFLKEKQLVPEKLFNQAELEDILVDLDPENCTYFQGILQNLFFATLNQRMGKDKNGAPFRGFAKDEGFLKNRQTHGVDNLYRYEEHFRDPDAALAHFADVPFLNGGLFERLDPIDEETERQLYLDGFTRNKKKRACVPNRLFFGQGELDINQVTGEKRKGKVKALGLLRILHGYKFTIVENTPIDQEIALDPELLGKVFENLLASYNEETKTTARKQTGSFYTPRPIVEYMVDETLKAHLSGALVKAGMREKDAQAGLDILFAYTEKQHPFTDTKADTLLVAIHTCKILDPACGSGAFPMGMLQKLVYIIHKLDPDNAKWMQLQIDTAGQIPDSSARDAAIAAIERDFAENEDDYGRKLYLIENCLYGVDIQPIAIQISKLRFFISLVCDQRTNRNKQDNHGVRPLPNLETKFVAADTLIGLPEMDQLELVDPQVHKIESEIEALYHSHFSIQRRDQKLALQRKIKERRKELGRVLAGSIMAPKKAQHIADWDPFDPQSSSDFFDPHWMFGRSLGEGFDIVLGNPPFQSAIEHKRIYGDEYRNSLRERHKTTTGTWDLYVPFFEVSLNILTDNGILALITPNKYLSSSYGIGLRTYLPTVSRIVSLTDVSHLPVFESASVYPVISVLRKQRPKTHYDIALHLPNTRESHFDPSEYTATKQRSDALTKLPENLWGFLLSPNLPILEQLLLDCVPLDSIARVCATTTAAEADDLGRTLRSFPCKGWKTLNTGTIDPFTTHWETQPLRHQKRAIPQPVLPDSPAVSDNRRQLYSGPKILVAKMALTFEGYVDHGGEYAALNCNCVSAVHAGWTLDALALVLHSSVVGFAYKQYFDGLRMSGGYLPFQAPQLKTIPIPSNGRTFVKPLDVLGRLRMCAASTPSVQATGVFLADLSDACVMECYFRDHMAERDLLFLDDLAPHLDGYDPDAGETQQRDFLDHLYHKLNAPDSKIRNRLLRISADSPDLLAVIKAEGRP